jgi:tRNA (adenine57-N1/adenine58-N1)-methyltransferase
MSSEEHHTLASGDWVVLADRRGHKNLFRLRAGDRLHVSDGWLDCDALIGQDPGLLARTNKGEAVAIFRATLDEYIVMMPRAAQIVTPKDIALIVQWADIFPGATVVEAGMGSGALALGLLRAIGSYGRLISFELREEFKNRGVKNIEAWDAKHLERLEVRLEDVHLHLQTLTGIDSVVLDLADPWSVLDGAARAMNPGATLVAYVPTVRQVDELVGRIIDHRYFAHPEVMEAIVRPWEADKVRLRPASRITGHTGFLIRTRRLGASPAPRS